MWSRSGHIHVVIWDVYPFKVASAPACWGTGWKQPLHALGSQSRHARGTARLGWELGGEPGSLPPDGTNEQALHLTGECWKRSPMCKVNQVVA